MKNTVNTTNLEDLADRMLDEHQLEDAEQVYNRLYSENKYNTKALLGLGTIAMNRGNYNEAISKLQEVININPDCFDAVYNLGRIYQFRGLQHDALDCLLHAATLRPSSTELLNLISKIYLQLDQYRECESSCIKALQADAGNTEAMMLLADSYTRQGKTGKAISTYEELLDAIPDNPAAWYLLGSAHLKEGNISGAIHALRESLRLDPGNTQAHITAGDIYISQNMHNEAIAHFKEAATLSPNFTGAWDKLFYACKQNDTPESMAEYCRNSIEHYPDNPHAWTYMGYTLEFLQQHESALSSYKHAVSLTTGRYDLWERMGNICTRLGRNEEALTYLQKALESGANNPQTQLSYARLMRAIGCDTECEHHCRIALKIYPDYTPALIELGMVHIDKGEYTSAICEFNQAKSIDPGNTEIASGLAQAYDRLGEHDKAYDAIHPFLQSDLTDPGIACTYARISSHINRMEDAVTLIEGLTRRSTPTLSQRIDLHFMAGFLYDKLEKYSSAMQHFSTANALKPTNFTAAGYNNFINNIIKKFNSDTFERLPRAGLHSGQPIFIVGMMRSGTSLTEQILAAHNDVYGCGELMGMTQAAREAGMYRNVTQPGPPLDELLTQEKLNSLATHYLESLPAGAHSARFFTDKMPNNFLNLGLVALLFPNAKIIHVNRNPLDTCLSAYFINFSGRHDYAYSLENLGFFYRQYQKLMEHWKSTLPLELLDIEYESLVRNPEEVCHSLIDFCGLDWDERILDFHTSKRLVNTASYNQVKRPIYTSSIGHWKKYEEHLGPLITALGLE